MEGRYPVLRFFCDWPLHPVLDRCSANLVLDKFEPFVNEYNRGADATEEILMALKPFTSFGVLRTELLKILWEHGRDCRNVADIERWDRLLRMYVQAISRTPLRCGMGNHRRQVQTILVWSICAPQMEVRHKVFGPRIVWRLFGPSLDLSIHNDSFLDGPPNWLTFPILKLTNGTGGIQRSELDLKTF